MSEARRTRVLLALLAAEAAVCFLLGTLGTAAGEEAGIRPGVREALRELVVELRLTDLALWSGPAYCRHPSQADLFAPFSDHPGALEHFPAGSLVPPPADLFPLSGLGPDGHAPGSTLPVRAGAATGSAFGGVP